MGMNKILNHSVKVDLVQPGQKLMADEAKDIVLRGNQFSFKYRTTGILSMPKVILPLMWTLLPNKLVYLAVK